MSKETVKQGEMMTIEIPVRKATHGYKSNRIDMELGRVETDVLADIFSGLQLVGATLKSGKLVGSPNQAIVWILQNIKIKKTD